MRLPQRYIAILFSLFLLASCLPKQEKLIAFSSDRDGNSEIYVMRVDGNYQTRLTNNSELDLNPTWSPDGKKIAYICAHQFLWEICLVDSDGANQKRLTNINKDILHFAWSPNGKKIAFVAYDDDKNLEIYIVNVSDSNVIQLTNTDSTTVNDTLSWSPDSKQIVFISTRDDISEIYKMNVDGTEQKRLTFLNDWLTGLPIWSPDGEQIGFRSAKKYQLRFSLMSSDGSQQRFFTPIEIFSMIWSPNGEQIAIEGRIVDNNSNSEIYTINSDGSDLRQLTYYQSSSPAWSPDNKQIVFTAYQNDNWQVYVMNSDGSQQTCLTRLGSNGIPSWQP